MLVPARQVVFLGQPKNYVISYTNENEIKIEFMFTRGAHHFQNPIRRNVNLGVFISELNDSNHLQLGTLLLTHFLHNMTYFNLSIRLTLM